MLLSLDPGASPDILAALAVDRHSWLDLAEYRRHTRWTARLATYGHQEVWLQSWLPGQATDLHEHRHGPGAHLVLQGTLTEFVVNPDGSHVRTTWTDGTSGRHPAGHRHRLGNDDRVPAVSIHLVTPTGRLGAP